MEKLFDTHAHYTDENFYGNNELINSIFSSDVGYILTAAVNADDSEKCALLAEKYDNMYASAGIHPEEAENISDIENEILHIEKILSMKKVVAIGEIGLDYHYGKTERAFRYANGACRKNGTSRYNSRQGSARGRIRHRKKIRGQSYRRYAQLQRTRGTYA